MAEIAASLSDCTKGGPMRQECDQAFRTLKDRLASKPVLQSPDFDKEFILQSDASGRAWGSVESRGPGWTRTSSSFPKQKLLPREQKYAAVELECLVIVWAVQTLHVYLDGRRFTLETDHRALSHVQ